jgi:glycosyltransferase involved in cell wall biosynthesis
MNDSQHSPLITTMIPTYRRPALLQRAIRSVLNQSYPHFQVCVYDNASGDETASVVAELARSDPRVKYYCHSENIGAFRNFVYGMQRVNTPFFSLLSDDDLLLSHAYETAMEGFDRFPDVIFSGGTTLITDKGEIQSASPPSMNGYYSPPDGLFEVMKDNITWTSIVFRKEVVDEVGLLDERVGGLIDLDFLFRVTARFPFVIVQQPCALFVNHESNYVASRTLKLVWPGWLNMVGNLIEDERIPPNIRVRAEQVLIKDLQPRLFGLGMRSVKEKELDEAYRAVDILNRYHQRTKALILYTTASFRQYLPPAYNLLVLLHKIRMFIKRRFGNNNLRNLRRQFGHYKLLIK